MIIISISAMDKEADRMRMAEIYHRYKRLILYLARDRLKSESIAEEILGDVMLVIIERFDRISGCSEEEIKRFIYIVTRNMIINRLKKEQRYFAQSADELHLASRSDLYDQLACKEIMQFIFEMNPRYRDVLELKIVYDLSPREIAKALGISEGAARKRLERARKLVKEAMNKEEHTVGI